MASARVSEERQYLEKGDSRYSLHKGKASGSQTADFGSGVTHFKEATLGVHKVPYVVVTAG